MFTIPNGAKLVTITALGASGGGFDVPTMLPGGVGGFLQARFDVSSAESTSTGLKEKEAFTITVGGQAAMIDAAFERVVPGGANGGGLGSFRYRGVEGRGGGGSSSVLRNIDKMYLIVAGGGGGAATPKSKGGDGGAGESLVGGTDVHPNFDEADGLGGTQKAGGVGGKSSVRYGDTGHAGQGGSAGPGGGGGGGGYYGGGGGTYSDISDASGGSGGGGSSFVSELRSGKFTNLRDAIYGNGKIIIKVDF